MTPVNIVDIETIHRYGSRLHTQSSTFTTVDVLGGLLDGVRARGAFVLRLSLDPPWSMRIQDDAPLTLICMTHGEAVLVTDAGDTVVVRPGDVAVAKGCEHYLFADDAETEPQVVIHPGNRCTTLRGEDLRFAMAVGVRTWGNAASGSHRAVICAYQDRSEVSSRLLDALPTMFVLRSEDVQTPLVGLLTVEAGRDGPGQESYLDRLLDLLLMDVLRTWFDRDEHAPAWWRAEHDPIVGPALRLLYNNPEHGWTVANLAAAVGCSRALLARRFTDQVGEPPISFLTSWRLALAADKLRSGPTTIAAIARQVGYGTPFALSSAFKRAYGMSPNAHREASRRSGA
jgi:AraC-like DNA-binding protein